MDSKEQELYNTALKYATKKHLGQFRKGGEPYIVHPIAVAQILKEEGYGVDYQIAGLFHDLLEDTDATQEEILNLSNEEILHSVILLTKQKGYDMATYINDIKNNHMAFKVKSADRLHNLQSAFCTSNEFKIKYIKETVEWFFDFSAEIIDATKLLAKSLDKPLTEYPFLYK